jgi:hypothetical protein
VTGEEQAVTSGFMPICKHELYETKAYRWGHVCQSLKFLLEKRGRFIEFVIAVLRKNCEAESILIRIGCV